VVHVPDGADVDVGFGPLKFLLCHWFFLLVIIFNIYFKKIP